MSSPIPKPPTGFHDFGPTTMLKRKYLINILEATFKTYGCLPLQTPAIEQLTTLTGKYGEEGEQLLYKVLDTGNFLKKTKIEDYTSGVATLLPKIAKKGLRYDLTIPLARFIATHRHTLTFPFKRFQIQPVWRADRPQKGRYREFYQCDADIVGSTSLLYETEMLVIINEILHKVGIQNFSIQLNHRLILKALASHLQMPDKEVILCRILDKLDKLGIEKVLALLHQQGISAQTLKKTHFIFDLQGTTQERLATLYTHLGNQPAGKQALEALEKLFSYTRSFGLPEDVLHLTPTLARGLDYYTGTVFEVKVKGATIGSIAGGGRYNNLTSTFGVLDIPGVGVSFGLERLYQILETRNLFPKDISSSTQLLLVPMTKEAERVAIQHLVTIRNVGIATELYPASKYLQKPLTYADKKRITWVVIIGEEEVKKNLFILKNMFTREQKSCSFEEIVYKIK